MRRDFIHTLLNYGVKKYSCMSPQCEQPHSILEATHALFAAFLQQPGNKGDSSSVCEGFQEGNFVCDNYPNPPLRQFFDSVVFKGGGNKEKRPLCVMCRHAVVHARQQWSMLRTFRGLAGASAERPHVGEPWTRSRSG